MYAILGIQKSSDPAKNNTTFQSIEIQAIDKSPNWVFKYVIILSTSALLETAKTSRF
jgi:hypothetical protein